MGLRKICVALDIPLPPRGYWAKLASGKVIPKPSLHPTDVTTTYQRLVNIVNIDEVLEARVAKVRDSAADAMKSVTPAYSPPTEPPAFSAQAKLVVRALKSAKLDEGAFRSMGATWADVCVSEDLKERALLLVDRFAHELELVGARFENSQAPLPPLRRGGRREYGLKRNCFVLHGEQFFVRIQERIMQELVPPPPAKVQRSLRRGAREPTWEYRPPEYRYIPTGKLSVAIVDVQCNYERCKVEDSARGTIEVKVQKAVQTIESAALRRRVEMDVRAERELARRKKAEEWEVAKKNKDSLLAELGAFEKMAMNLERARSLRRLMAEIAATTASPAELVGKLELIALMADWLDPLVKAEWPEVDSVGDKNPYGTLW